VVQLGVDDLEKAFLIGILELLGVEGSGFLLDQGFRQLNLFLVNLGGRWDVGEDVAALAHFVFIAQRFDDEPIAGRLDRGDALLP
jgi:hypothetical protein